MTRPGAVTFKGNPLTLVGTELKDGDEAPAFTVHRFVDGAMRTLTLEDLKGKPALISVVPSLDTPVCATQTKTFNEKLGQFGNKINAVTVSMDLPFAQNRFCGAESITHLITASDYQNRDFGQNWGMLIEELKILARGIFVLDSDGKVVYAQVVPEVTSEPDYDAALAALKELAG